MDSSTIRRVSPSNEGSIETSSELIILKPVATITRPLHPLFEVPFQLAKSTLEEARRATVLLHLAIFLSYEAINLVFNLSNKVEGSKFRDQSNVEGQPNESKSQVVDIQDLIELAFTIESIYNLIVDWRKPDAESLDLGVQVESAQRLYAELHNRANLANLSKKETVFNAIVQLDGLKLQTGVSGESKEAWSTFQPPHCKCGEPAELKVSRSQTSLGRKYYTCSRCKFFKWAALPSSPSLESPPTRAII
ncbi:hypothetical protein FRC14_000621 [Serendipita sp. 396]|nr:hypothetical protein FRC14_000621 [Serendipita sp. 396]KAG8775424.1 hypothetical protein FRC15_000529 [Serendipita sp. 397]KAG8819736.1 hypothetical protein FRC18_011928 [Serendipita sp. 400]KAG8856167.1 hypothetical protein FRC20_000535 [Serendipita sp. 405]